MSRTIKFKVWDKALGKWITDANRLTVEDLNNKERFISYQYTGIKDANGDEIYEGDILRIHTVKVNEENYINGAVYYNDYEGMYVTYKGYILGRIAHRVEVIGHIRLNKDLLD